MNNNFSKASDLAKRHSVFTIHTPIVVFSNASVDITYRFSATGGLSFSPTTRINGRSVGKEAAINRLAIYGSLVESLSYWKSCYSSKILVEPRIPREVYHWFEDLLLNGMMEYRYTNGLNAQAIPEIEWAEDSEITGVGEHEGNPPLVLTSGGKDSTVTLSLLHSNGPIKAFVLNHLPAAERVLTALPDIEIVRGVRNIDPALLELNKNGYLNGHTPFSALLSVLSTLAALLVDASAAIVSNEASAESPFTTYEGLSVNHQYSKSFKYENIFANMIAKTLPGTPLWFSFLRPLAEPQVCQLLSRRTKLLSLISSCNKNQATGSWCGSCPKCVSTWILLRPFVKEGELLSIFGKNAMEEGKTLLPALLGKSECRPLECVGTPDELEASLQAVAGRKEALTNILSQFASHQMPVKYEHLLKVALEETHNA